MMCKRNSVFFQQQFVAHHTPPIPVIASPNMIASFIRKIALIVVTGTLFAGADVEAAEQPACCQTYPLDASSVADIDACSPSDITVQAPEQGDRIWLISTRHLPSDICQVDLQQPPLGVFRIDPCGSPERTTLAELESRLRLSRRLVVYVHGNRMDLNSNLTRGMWIYRDIKRCRDQGAVDWVLWSWPAAKEGLWLKDFREKAERTDGQGLYLAWFLRRQVQASIPTSMIGFSYGARVVTGSLHALAGGKLGSRCLPGEVITGAPINAGLIAPAIASNWLCERGYHGMTTKNLQELVLLYNGRDAVLKRYWRLARMPGTVALGYSGPQGFGLRADGTRLQVRSRDCAFALGLKHAEMDYYLERSCCASAEMASVINASSPSPGL
jgi:hypothetical protein